MKAAGVRLELEQNPPQYRNDRSRAEVARLAGNGQNAHNQQGLTRAQTELSLNAVIDVVSLGPGRYCLGLSEVLGIWRLTRLDVDIVHEQPPGSCPHAVILAHESQHVAVAQSLFIRHSGPIRARLTQLVGEMRPFVSTLPPSAAKLVLRDRLLAGMRTTLAAFERDLARANAALDTPQNYRTETAKCPRWN